MQVQTARWEAFNIQTGSTYMMFYLLLSIEYAFILAITDFLSSPTTGEYVFFILFVAARCLITCVTVAQQKGLWFYRRAFLFFVGATTVFWVTQLSAGLFSYPYSSARAPKLMEISDVAAITANLIILIACLWSAWNAKRSIK